MHQLEKQKSLVGPFWAREFPIAHINADDYWLETPINKTSSSV
jgi:hypothetical protein